MHAVVLRAKKISSRGSASASLQHTFRERETPNALPGRLADNEILRGGSAAVDVLAALDARLSRVTAQASQRPVLAVEYVVTAAAAAFREGGGSVDSGAYLRDALAWLEKRHGAENVVSAVIHRDELAPHLTVMVVPLVETAARDRRRSVIIGTDPSTGQKLRETRLYHEPASCRLSAAHYLNGRKKLADLQTGFADDVGKTHGLARGIKGSRAAHQTVRDFYGALNAPLEHLEVPASAVTPRVVKAGGLFTHEEREAPATVAGRVTRDVERFYEPMRLTGLTAQADRQRQKDLAATLRAKERELEALAPFVELRAVAPSAFDEAAAEAAARVAHFRALSNPKGNPKGALMQTDVCSASPRPTDDPKGCMPAGKRPKRSDFTL